MRCYCCGGKIPANAIRCPFCGHQKNRLIYVRSLGIAGGLMASFAGYTLYDVPGAVFGGFGAIVALEIIARMILRPRSGERVP